MMNTNSIRTFTPASIPLPWKLDNSKKISPIVKICQPSGSKPRVAGITMRDRSKNRKPLQRGRNLSIEAIQAIQALKRGFKQDQGEDRRSLQRVIDSNFKRLLKFDMIAVLRDLIRQNECLLALKVYEDVRKEYWYKPQLLLYADMVSALLRNGLLDELRLVFMTLKQEPKLEPDIEGFNVLLMNLVASNATANLAIECLELMKQVGCDPDRSSYKILINGLESMGETTLSYVLIQEARKCFGESFEYLEEESEPLKVI